MVKGFNVKQESRLLTEGVQEARILRVIDLGIQPQPEQYGKDPKPMLKILFEVANDKVNLDGVDFPAVISMRTTLARGDKAKLNKLRQAVGLPEEFSFEELLGKPLSLTIETKTNQQKQQYSVVAGFSGLSKRVADTVPALVAPSYVFDFDEPDPKLVESFSEFMIKDLMKALNYKGSELEAMINSLALLDEPDKKGLIS